METIRCDNCGIGFKLEDLAVALQTIQCGHCGGHQFLGASATSCETEPQLHASNDSLGYLRRVLVGSLDLVLVFGWLFLFYDAFIFVVNQTFSLPIHHFLRFFLFLLEVTLFNIAINRTIQFCEKLPKQWAAQLSEIFREIERPISSIEVFQCFIRHTYRFWLLFIASLITLDFIPKDAENAIALPFGAALVLGAFLFKSLLVYLGHRNTNLDPKL